MLFPHAAFDMVRPGIASYGLWPGDELRRSRPLDLRPVMSLRARVTHLKTVPRGASVSYGALWRAPRPSRIATVAAGYADGVPRLVTGQAQVLVCGVPAPIVGRVTMDQVLVDVTGVAGVELGAVVTLWGRDGSEEITVDDVAGWAQTIGYEVVCGVAPRVRRVTVSENP
jgi:alanine racemase